MLALLPADIFGFLLVFARVGAALMVLPGIGEPFVPTRVRLVLALALAAVVLPGVPPLPPLPAQPAELALLIGGETLIGVAVGLISRLLFTALHVAGSVIGLQTGLSFAQFYDPMQGGQNVLVGTLLSMMGMVAIFATDLHLALIRGIADSYLVIAPGAAPPAGDAADAAGRMVAAAFALGMKIAAPFIVYGIIFQVSAGVLARLMPQIQISFVAMPLQILLGYGLMLTALPIGIIWFLDRMAGATLLGVR
jgi:flagellar biosynthesis protein FliR